MKRFVSALLALVMVLSLAACGNSESKAPAAPAASAAPEASAAPAAPAEAESDWPTGTVQFIVAASAGGGTDLAARMVAEKMSKVIGKNIVVLNQKEGGGAVAFDTVMSDDEETLNIGFFIPSFFTSYITGSTDMSPVDDFQCASFFATESASYLCVKADSPFNTAEELIEYAKAHPGELTFGLSVGSRTHFTIEEFARAAGIQFKYVEAGNVADAIPALVGGHIDIAYLNSSNAKAYAESGDVKLIASNDEPIAREGVFADVPCFAQLGYDQLRCKMDYFMVVSNKASEATVKKINEAFQTTVSDPEVIEGFHKLSNNVVAQDYETSQDSYKKAFDNFDKIGEALGVKAAR